MAEANLVVGEENVFEYLMQQRAAFYPNASDVKEWKRERRAQEKAKKDKQKALIKELNDLKKKKKAARPFAVFKNLMGDELVLKAEKSEKIEKLESSPTITVGFRKGASIKKVTERIKYYMIHTGDWSEPLVDTSPIMSCSIYFMDHHVISGGIDTFSHFLSNFRSLLDAICFDKNEMEVAFSMKQGLQMYASEIHRLVTKQWSLGKLDRGEFLGSNIVYKVAQDVKAANKRVLEVKEDEVEEAPKKKKPKIKTQAQLEKDLLLMKLKDIEITLCNPGKCIINIVYLYIYFI